MRDMQAHHPTDLLGDSSTYPAHLRRTLLQALDLWAELGQPPDSGCCMCIWPGLAEPAVAEALEAGPEVTAFSVCLRAANGVAAALAGVAVTGLVVWIEV